MTLKFDGWPWKTIGHLFFAVSSFVQHFIRVRSNRLLQNSLTFPWHLPDSIHISLTKRNNKSVNDRFYRAFLKISDPWQKWWCQQNNVKSIFEKVLIWENLCLDLANWSIYMVTGESCCLKWSFSLTLCEIPWHFSSILPNVKISLTLYKIPWQFPDLEKFYFSLTFPWRLWTLFHSHRWIQTGVTVLKRPIWVKFDNF